MQSIPSCAMRSDVCEATTWGDVFGWQREVTTVSVQDIRALANGKWRHTMGTAPLQFLRQASTCPRSLFWHISYPPPFLVIIAVHLMTRFLRSVTSLLFWGILRIDRIPPRISLFSVLGKLHSCQLQVSDALIVCIPAQLFNNDSPFRMRQTLLT